MTENRKILGYFVTMDKYECLGKWCPHSDLLASAGSTLFPFENSYTCLQL